MSGFRIINLSVRDHPVLGTNTFKFFDNNDDDKNSPYFTVLIGPNGTGKSEILRCLLLVWRDFYQKFVQNDSKLKPLQFSFTLVYTLKGKKYNYSNGLHIKFNTFTKTGKSYPEGKLYDAASNVIALTTESYYDHFPLQIVAQSILMTDKYFVPRNEKDKLRFAPYHYLGIRNRPQQSSTGYYVRRTVDLIIKAIEKDYFKSGVKKLVEYIDASGSFIIQYQTINNNLFYSGNLTYKILEDYFFNIEETYQERQAPYKLGHYKKLKKNKGFLIKIVDFVNRLANESRLNKINRSSAKSLEFDLLNDSHMVFLKKHQYDLDWLRKIGLLTNPIIKLSDKDVELQNASSGEFHLFTTMIGLMASTRANSLVIIDEPEISLHPNWQMRYLQFIRELFENTDRVTSHIILATHSHFLISDLPGDNSNIIGLKKENGSIKPVEINRDTFGWSAEEILLEIFQVPTTRNHYVSAKIGAILDEIAKPDKNVDLIKNNIEDLKTNNIDKLSKEDPLKEIIEKLISKYG